MSLRRHRGKAVAALLPLVLGGGQRNGSVGDSGNAKLTPPRLRYAIVTAIPHPWRRDGSSPGWKKMFLLEASCPPPPQATEALAETGRGGGVQTHFTIPEAAANVAGTRA